MNSNIDPTKGCRDGYSFVCGNSDCGKSFSGDELANIFQRAADHWNREHGDELKHQHEVIDTVEYGGHHIQGNAYEVRKYHVYLTSFDMADRLGCIDGRLVNDSEACSECLCDIPDEDDRVEEDPDDVFNDEWTCSQCLEQQEIERRESQNQSITDWAAAEE